MSMAPVAEAIDDALALGQRVELSSDWRPDRRSL